MGSLNGVAPGPGPIFSPSLETTDGPLSDYTGDPFTLASGGVQLAAPIVGPTRRFHPLPHEPPVAPAQRGAERVRRRLGDEPDHVHLLPARRPGRADGRLSRTGYTGAGPAGQATVRVGTVKLDASGAPELGRVVAVRHALVRNGQLTKVRVPVARTPLTVSVTVMPTFSTPTDSRLLAAQPAFSFRRGEADAAAAAEEYRPAP